jgi:menaquinone-dependent protoporphyrinogen oxidase
MNILVTYASALGSTAAIAERIAQTLRAEGATVTCAAAETVSDETIEGEVDAFVVGSAVHASHWLPAGKSFAERLMRRSTSRPVWLFSSGPVGAKYVVMSQPEPKEIGKLRQGLAVKDHVVFAGAFDRTSPGLARLGAVERFAARWIPEGDFRQWPLIDSWAIGIAKDLGRASTQPI